MDVVNIDELIRAGVFQTDKSCVTVHWDHEARYLQLRLQIARQFDQFNRGSASSNGAAIPTYASSFGSVTTDSVSFTQSLRHSCKDDECALECLTEGEVFQCPFEVEHAERQLHRASGDVYVCRSTGHVHICTIEMCEYQERQSGGSMTCLLTAKVLGAHILSVIETPYCFQDSTTHCTRVIEPDINGAVLGMRRFVKDYESKRPHNKEFVARTSEAIESLVKTEMSVQHQEERVELLPKPLPLYASTSSGLQLIGFQADGAKKPLAQLTNDTGGTVKRLDAASSSSSEPRRSKQKALTYVDGDAEHAKRRKQEIPQRSFTAEALLAEKLERVRSRFAETVATFFTHLKCVYSPDMWMKGIQRATRSAATTIASLDAKNARQSIFRADMKYGVARDEFYKATHACFVGLEYVFEMNQWEPWRSGEFKKTKSKELVDRMVKVWMVIVRSPEFTQPCLYNSLANVLLDFVIKGLKFETCLYQTPPEASVRCVCDTYSANKCVHKKLDVNFIAQDKRMYEIVNAPGIPQRLDTLRLNESRLAGTNTALRLYGAFMTQGIPLSRLAEWIVKA